MAAATQEVLVEQKGDYPRVQTYEIAAGELILKGTNVALDGNGRAVAPTDEDNLPVVGTAVATYNNTNGANGDLSAQVQAGVFGCKFTGTTPTVGAPMYSVDNQTVSADSQGGTPLDRGPVGFASEIRNSLVFVEMGPTRFPLVP